MVSNLENKVNLTKKAYKLTKERYEYYYRGGMSLDNMLRGKLYLVAFETELEGPKASIFLNSYDVIVAIDGVPPTELIERTRCLRLV